MPQVLTRHKDSSGMCYWTGSLTASKEFQTPNGRDILHISAQVSDATSTNVDKLAQFSWVKNASDNSKFTLYGWKATVLNGGGANVTRIAQTAAVNISLLVWTE